MLPKFVQACFTRPIAPRDPWRALHLSTLIESRHSSGPSYKEEFCRSRGRRRLSSISASSSEVLEISSSNVDIQTINVHTYLTQIENELQRQESLCDNLFKVRIRQPNYKPMIRTLLGYSNKKIDFDELLRSQKRQMEFDALKFFCVNVLAPRIELILEKRQKWGKPTENEDSVLVDFKDNLHHLILKKIPKQGNPFHRLAGGRTYKGNFKDLVEDLCPDLVGQVEKALTPLTEAQALLSVIDLVASTRVIDQERIDAATKCANLFSAFGNDEQEISIGKFSPQGATDDNSNTVNANWASKVNGKECEDACISWLEDNHDDSDQQVCSNVFINDRATGSRPKYLDNNRKRCKELSNSGTAIIWTNTSRDKLCSEFDALVMKSTSDMNVMSAMETCYISEVWEAKYSISPASIYDAMTKKVYAIRNLLSDSQATLSKNGQELKLVESKSGLTFGIFGIELLPPMNAIGQLRSTAVSYALNTDVGVVIKALENGYIQIDSAKAWRDLHGLRNALKANADFQIVLKLHSNCE